MSELTQAQRDDLRTVAAMIIPASDEYKVPGADDPAIQADMLATRPAAATLVRVVLQCYYRDDRVLRSLGIELRAPFPKGHVLPDGDWSLLDPVKARPMSLRRA
jgi:hypothetical protein